MPDAAPAPQPAAGKSIGDAASVLAAKWGASLSVDDAGGDAAPVEEVERPNYDRPSQAQQRRTEEADRVEEARLERQARREERQAQLDAEEQEIRARKAAERDAPKGDAESGETSDDASGETESKWTDLDEILEAAGVSADALPTKFVDENGKPMTLAEALNQPKFEADYRRQTQALSEERKAFEAQRQQHAQQVAAIGAQAQAMQSVVNEIFDAQEQQVHEMYKGVDWNGLLTQDRTEWMVAQQQYRNALDAVARNRQVEMQKVAQKYEAMRAPAAALSGEMLKAQRQRLAELVPEWAEPEKAREGGAKVTEYLKARMGAHDAELAQMQDARLWALGQRSMQRDDWVARAEALGTTVEDILAAAEKAPEVEERVRTRTLTPGAQSSARPLPQAAQEERTALQRLRKSGRQEDAVAAMNARLAARGL